MKKRHTLFRVAASLAVISVQPVFANQGPPFNDRTVTAPNSQLETYTWGHAAIGGINLATPLAPPIYVIDNGVALHSDLNVTHLSVVQNDGIIPVGCEAHATHVAGIIGAAHRNGGVSGVLAGAPIYSVTVNDANGAGCSTRPSTNTPARIVAAIERVRSHIQAGGRVGVVNISMNNNDGAFGPSNGSIHEALKNLAKPVPGYPGAFVAQSAGNNNGNACQYAYSTGQPYGAYETNSADGIMVVGGLGPDGRRMSTEYLNGPNNDNAPASNAGLCVEIWAPSASIKSTWGPPGYTNDPANYQQQGTTYGNYNHMGGTSMAAPFVAGIAAAILQAEPINPATGQAHTPGTLEQRIRAAAQPLSPPEYHDGVNIVNIARNPVASLSVNPAPGRLSNISTRGYVQHAQLNQQLIGGFIIQHGAKELAVKSVGPSLAQWQVPNVLADPKLTIPGMVENNNWQEDGNWPWLQAKGMAPSNYYEPGVLRSFSPNVGYSAIVEGVGGSVGMATVEVYETNPSDPGRLINLATRGYLPPNSWGPDYQLIGGITVVGPPVTVALRALGPTLNQYGLPGATNPKIKVFSGQTLIAEVDDWYTGPTMNGQVVASKAYELSQLGWAPPYGVEPAILLRLTEGAYTFQVSEALDWPSVSIIEAYLVITE